MDEATDSAVPNPSELEARAEEAATFLRSLASRHRLMILCSLLAGERWDGG